MWNDDKEAESKNNITNWIAADVVATTVSIAQLVECAPGVPANQVQIWLGSTQPFSHSVADKLRSTLGRQQLEVSCILDRGLAPTAEI